MNEIKVSGTERGDAVGAVGVPQPSVPEQDYLNLLAYIVSNTVAGEIMAVDNYSEMVPLVETLEEKIATLNQAREESKHVRLLANLGKRLGFPVAERVVEPQWKAIRGHFSTAARDGNLAACLIIQDLMVESGAITLYRALSGMDDAVTDEETRRVAANILRDEIEHLEIGIQRIKRLLQEDSEGVHDSLIWAHHRVMPELFSTISTSCESLCGVLDLDCGSLNIDDLKTDLDTLRFGVLSQYVETLDRVGFDSKICAVLIAGMAAYDGMPTAAVGDQLSGVASKGSISGKKCC